MDWLELLYQIFQVAIIPLLGAVTLYLISFINTKTKELKKKTENEKVKEYIDMLNDTITSCVRATTQTYVNTLKQQGKFDVEAQRIALNKTYDSVMTILTEDAKNYLYKGVADLEQYILNKIESEVAITKTFYK